MDNKKKVLDELLFRKNQAIGQPVKLFPLEFYKLSEIILTTAEFLNIIQKYLSIDQDYFPEYTRMIEDINGIGKSICRLLSKYMSTINVNSSILAQLQNFPSNKSRHLATAFQQVWYMRDIVKQLKKDQLHKHDSFLKKIASKIDTLEQLLQKLEQEHYYVFRMSQVRKTNFLQRIFRIYHTYNPRTYATVRTALVNEGRQFDVITLDVQYVALQKCIDPGSIEKLCYDENFDMEADKLAIQEACFLIEKEMLSHEPSDIIPPKIDNKLHFSKNGIGVDITYRGLKVSVGLRSEESKINKRKEIANLFSSKSQHTGRDVYDAISDNVPESGGLSTTEVEVVEKAVADFNKFLKKNLKISTALRIKGIERERGKIIVFMDEQYL